MKHFTLFAILTCSAACASARTVKPSDHGLEDKGARLRPGEYIWRTKPHAIGPVLVVIRLSRQRALLYRNSVLIAVSTISTGGEGRRTPTGSFTVLQKEVVHRSKTYDDAPMPFMQRLTWKGVAMHAGHVSGHPASHGCIRLPRAFAQRLYEITTLGTPVIITA